jgi:hypothetical protein
VARFYRITKNDPPTVEDFMSRAALGDPRPQALSQRRWEGVSMWTDLERVRRMALRTPRLGKFLAVVDLPDSVEREQEGPPGHFEVYGRAVDLHACVVETQPV